MCIKLKCIKAFQVQQINTKVAPLVSLVGVQLIILIVIQPFQHSPTISPQRHPPTPTLNNEGWWKKKKVYPSFKKLKSISTGAVIKIQMKARRRGKNSTYISNETFTAYLSAGCYGDGRTRTYILPYALLGLDASRSRQHWHCNNSLSSYHHNITKAIALTHVLRITPIQSLLNSSSSSVFTSNAQG